MSNSIPIILDTDIGSDIDDAVALAYLLKEPRCELLGITCVTGDVAKRCACADFVCRAAGRDDIPIHAGTSSVLLTGPGQPQVPQYHSIEHLPHRNDFPPNTALDFLRQTIRSRPHQITLLTIAPFTNIALLFAADPEIRSLLKSLVSMAGIFYPKSRRLHQRPREWNCMCDPIATSIVYNTKTPGHTSFGLDVTMKCQMRATEVRTRFDLPLLRELVPMAEVWFTQHEMLTFHDPLAAVSIFHPELCHYEEGLVEVPLSKSHHLQGRTLFTPAGTGPHRVAKTVNPNAFFHQFFSVFSL